MSKMKAIDLTIGYPKKVIAAKLNLSLKPGTLVCLLGQNGVGKSTLLRTLSNLQEPLQGQIKIEDEELADIDRRTLATKLGIITTDKIGTSNMTVRELVALGRYPYTSWLGNESIEDTNKIDSAISICKIDYIKEAKLSAISDGQFQKAMVARVLAQDTDIILMDEPTAHLDVVNRVEMFRLLQSIKEETQKSILISTHELDLSMQFADELWLMNYGKPMKVGSPEDLGYGGEIEAAFFHDEFRLDAKTGQVELQSKSEIFFQLQGDPDVIYWVEKALKRNGFGLSEKGKLIELGKSGQQVDWKEGESAGSSISKLIDHCNLMC